MIDASNMVSIVHTQLQVLVVAFENRVRFYCGESWVRALEFGQCSLTATVYRHATASTTLACPTRQTEISRRPEKRNDVEQKTSVLGLIRASLPPKLFEFWNRKGKPKRWQEERCIASVCNILQIMCILPLPSSFVFDELMRTT